MQREVVEQIQDEVQGYQLVHLVNQFRDAWVVCGWEPESDFAEVYYCERIAREEYQLASAWLRSVL